MNPVIIANTQIRADTNGRYCLNDLHQASGAEKRHQPANWLRMDQTKELIAELEVVPDAEGGLLTSEEAPLHTVNDGVSNGTYAVKPLVYSYAMWISAKFHLHVINAYDALVSSRPTGETPALAASIEHRADQMVSAQRIFAATLRVANAMRLGSRAMRAANDSTRRLSGIDWAEELDVDVGNVDPTEYPGMPDWADRDKVIAFVANRHSVTMDEILRELFPDLMDSKPVRVVIGRVLRVLGWHAFRKRLGPNSWGTEYRHKVLRTA